MTTTKKTSPLSSDQAQRLAILDLGTNTFHLNIYEAGEDKKLNELFKSKVFVKLAEKGMQEIAAEPFQRGLDTIRNFNENIRDFNSQNVYAYATAAMREANNSKQFLDKIEEETGIKVRIISGEQEAEFIYHGVKQALTFEKQPYLIMDIGGGSVEFIIASDEGVLWKKSYGAGAAILKQRFHTMEPMDRCEREDLEAYLEDMFSGLFQELEKHKITTMVGASGTFDTLAEMIAYEKGEWQDIEHVTSYKIDPESLKNVHKKLIASTMGERLDTNGLIPMRAEMIVVASVMIDVVIKMSNIKQVIRSNYSLQQGAAWCVVNEVEV